MIAVIYQFVHVLVISYDYWAVQVTKLSSGEMSRFHEKPRFIASDWDILPFPRFEIEYGSIFVDNDFT
jgi:hypothetical protein